MIRDTSFRLPAVAGVVAVVLILIADSIAGEPPSFDDPAAKIVAFYRDNHQAVLAGVILGGIGSALLIWLVAGLARALRDAGQGALGTLAFGAGIAAVSLGVAADALTGALAQVAREGDPRFVRSTYQVAGFLVEKSFWPAALLTLAAALAAWRTLPNWYARASLAAIPLLVLGGLSVKASGFFAPSAG